MSEIFYSPVGASHATAGRYCELMRLSEVSRLESEMDFRRPEYRREVFLRFYEWSLKTRSFPGCVYFMMPYLYKTQNWDHEARLWYAFLNGNTQNPVTSWIIFKRFPELAILDISALEEWFNAEFKRLAFDTDRRHWKSHFIKSVKCYQKLTKSRQEKFFAEFVNTEDPYENFRRAWALVREEFYSFGRLSAFSYLEYLRIMRVNLDCDQLFLEDVSGSKSHRNGLAKVLGRDDLDWHESNPTKFDGKYTPDDCLILAGRLAADPLHRVGVFGARNQTVPLGVFVNAHHHLTNLGATRIGVALTPEQAFYLVSGFPPLERTITLLAAATGLRISECLGLQWQDLDFEHQQIHVRRTWLGGQIGETKTKASKQPVAMAASLADVMREWRKHTPYSKPQDWIFPSQRLHGRKPRTGSVMAQQYLRPAAVKLGILAADDRRRFGFHNLRHSLASYLVTQTKTDVKTVQSMLRHADVGTTLGLYTHAINKDKLVAQNQVMEAMRKPGR